MKATRILTRRQQDTLWVVEQHGPVTAHEVGQHLRMDYQQAYGVLSRLERRSLVDATYTNLRAGNSGRGYTLTEKGLAAMESLPDERNAE